MKANGSMIAQFVLIGLAAVSASLPSHAEQEDWNQVRVTQLAIELTVALAATATAAAEAPPQITVLQQRSHDAAVSRLERVRTAAAEYVEKLEEDWSRDETAAYFWQVEVLLHKISEITGEAVHYERMKERWAASLETAAKIARYYGDD